VNRKRAFGLIACGATLVALVIPGLLFQFEDDLDGFLVVVELQAAIYAIAVRLIWNGGSSRRIVMGIAAVAIVMRIPIVIAPPYLSADVYRYVWDGRIEAAGFNPYSHEPVDPQLDTLRDVAIFPQIGSPYAPTIYPPAAEAIFLIVTRISETVTAMKITMVVFELITFVLLLRLLSLEGLPRSRLLIYAWHPLPVWEFAGSGHIDAALIALCVAALWAAKRRREGLAGLFVAGATLVKFYPAILLPTFYRRWDRKLPVLFTAAIVIAYLPFLSAGSHVLGFLPGYAGQEGFAAGGTGFYLLGLLRHLPPLTDLSARGYEAVALVILAGLGVVFVFRRDRSHAPYAIAAALAVLFTLLLSPHYPWYFSWLVPFACFVWPKPLLWLTTACLLLYLVADYAFVQSEQRLVIETIIYGPFAALMLADLWYTGWQTSARS
jgi:alpha-1,6-mannosyltransferase